MIINTEGIVLRSFDYRETSRIVTFFTKDHGKMAGVLKGIRKDHKKFGSSVDRFSVNHVVIYKYSRSDLHLVSQCDLKQYFFLIRQDYAKSLAANYILELVDTIMHSEDVNPQVFQLMVDFLESLEASKDVGKLVHLFQVKILKLSGFSPHLDCCVKCERQVTGKARFSMISGGLICADCPTAETSFSLISKGAISTILHIEDCDWQRGLRLGLTRAVQGELKLLLEKFLTYHLEKKLKSGSFL